MRFRGRGGGDEVRQASLSVPAGPHIPRVGRLQED